MHDYLSARGEYEQSVRSYTFNAMRNLFLMTFEDERETPTSRLTRMREDKREWAFMVVKTSKINVLRNEVAHKNAYRPKLTEIESHDDLIDALYWLGEYLHVLDSNFARGRAIAE